MRESHVLLLILCSLTSLLLAVVAGLLAALYYLPGLAEFFLAFGVTLQSLRPLHTTFASAFIFLGAIAVVYDFLLAEVRSWSLASSRLFRAQMVFWGLAGLGALVSLPFGITSGREYIGFHPLISVFILAGWGCFTTIFYSRVWRGYWERPVYVHMWAIGILYFIFTFVEAHAYLLPQVEPWPIVDLQLQWKSCGTIVGAFNLLVYGALLYIGERISGDANYAQSRKAFALFGIGLLNSFTNYAHHTYHLPQSHLIKWIAFVVSMLEIIILVIVVVDIAGMAKSHIGRKQFDSAEHFLRLSKYWSGGLLLIAIAISIPPLNALVHGTHAIMAHAMGSEIAIDGYILFGTFAMLLGAAYRRCPEAREILSGEFSRRSIAIMNLALLVLVAFLFCSGAAVGIARFTQVPLPTWTNVTPSVLVASGGFLALALAALSLKWISLIVSRDCRQHLARR